MSQDIERPRVIFFWGDAVRIGRDEDGLDDAAVQGVRLSVTVDADQIDALMAALEEHDDGETPCDVSFFMRPTDAREVGASLISTASAVDGSIEGLAEVGAALGSDPADDDLSPAEYVERFVARIQRVVDTFPSDGTDRAAVLAKALRKMARSQRAIADAVDAYVDRTAPAEGAQA